MCPWECPGWPGWLAPFIDRISELKSFPVPRRNVISTLSNTAVMLFGPKRILAISWIQVRGAFLMDVGMSVNI
jgi:hypothetical protein